MRNLKQQILLIATGTLVLGGCASTPMKELKPSEMLVSKQNKYVQMESSEGLTGWEKGMWEHTHKNYTLGRKLLEPYKDKDISKIQHAYGFMYQEGLGGLKKDFKKAVEHYKRAIKIDSYSPSLYNLSFLYKAGVGISKDMNKYFEVLQKSAKQGYVYAQFNLADNYHFERNGVSEDFGKAYYWYQQASNQGLAKAARRIGWMYDRGEGFKRDAQKAFEWHKLATKRGNNHSRGDMIRLKSELYRKNKNK